MLFTYVTEKYVLAGKIYNYTFAGRTAEGIALRT